MGFGNRLKKAFGMKDKQSDSQNHQDNTETQDVEAKLSDGFEDGFLNESEPAGPENKNFKYLDDLIHSGAKEIVLDSDILLEDDEQFDYFEGIRLDGDGLVIDGNNHIIDAQLKTRIFEVAGDSITLKNISFKGGYAQEGGAIHSCKNLTVEDSSFSNCSGYYGGAISNHGNLNLSRCTFQKCNSYEGGAIKNSENSLLNIGECKFYSNYGKKIGGALHNSSKISLADCTFEDNHAGQGGAIYASQTSILEISDCRFDKNGAGKMAGAINNTGNAQMNVLNCRFGENHADYGGVIGNEGNLTLEGCHFKANFANDNGGVISNFSAVELRDCEFSSNRAEKEGGVIENHENGFFDMDNIHFNDNSANDGGAIGNNGTIRLSDSWFIANRTTGNAGAIVNRSIIELKNTHFIKNSAKKNSGAILNGENAKMAFENCDFNENSSGAECGAIYNFGRMNLTKINFKANRSEATGAVVNRYGGVIIAEECIFEANTGTTAVGALYNFGQIDFKNTVFQDNFSNLAGAIANDVGSKSTCYSCDFIANNGNEYASIANNSDDAKFIGCSFKKHSNVAIIIYNKNSISLESCDITDNDRFIAGLHNHSNSKSVLSKGKIEGNTNCRGTLFFNTGEYASVDATIFAQNTYDESGRQAGEHFDCINATSLVLQSPKFERDDCILNDGHIEVKNSTREEVLRIIKCEPESRVDFAFDDDSGFDFSQLNEMICNSAGETIKLEDDFSLKRYEKDFFEGGIEIDIAELTVDGCGHTIDANGYSRVFNIVSGKITLKNITFRNGKYFKAVEPHISGGGAVNILKNSNVTFENCKFISNESEDNGGAIKNDGQMQSIGNEYRSNNARNYAGAIQNNGVLHIADDTFTENSSKIAAAIYNAGNLTLKGDIDMLDNSSDFSQSIYNAGYIESAKTDIDDDVYDTNETAENQNFDSFEILKSVMGGSGGTLQNDIRITYAHIDDFEIALDSDLTLDGNGHCIDMNYFPVSFKIRGDVSFKNITFKNAAPISDSLFDVMGRATFENVTFLNNCIGNAGRLISNDGGEVRIAESRFFNNRAKAQSLIYTSCLFEVTGTEFVNNLALASGTILYNERHNSKKALVEDCTFMSNFSRYGGLVYNSERSTIEFSKGEFISNFNDLKCGAIYNEGLINVFNVAFIKNSTNNSAGAIFNQAACVLDRDCEFDSNTAKDCGAVYNGGKLYVKNTQFKDNAAEGRSGAIGNDGEINLNDSGFENNSAAYGGAIYNYGDCTLFVEKCRFIKNFADNAGAAIYNMERSYVEAVEVVFEGNISVEGSAIIANYNAEEVKMISCMAYDNQPEGL